MHAMVAWSIATEDTSAKDRIGQSFVAELGRRYRMVEVIPAVYVVHFTGTFDLQQLTASMTQIAEAAAPISVNFVATPAMRSPAQYYGYLPATVWPLVNELATLPDLPAR